MLHDLDDHEYIDYVLSWGPLILGHAHPGVVKAIRNAAARGTSFGTPTEAESELAELIVVDGRRRSSGCASLRAAPKRR